MSAVLKNADCYLTLREMEQLARRITYRPGWAVEINANYLAVWVTISGPTVCAKTGAQVTFKQNVMLDFIDPQRITMEEFKRAILAALLMVESHEAREFFKIGGIQVFDPHISNRTENAAISIKDKYIEIRNYYV